MGTGIGLSASGWTKVKWSVISAVGGLIAVALVTFGWGIFKSGARAQAEEFIVETVGEQVTKQLNAKIEGVESKVDAFGGQVGANSEAVEAMRLQQETAQAEFQAILRNQTTAIQELTAKVGN